MGGYPRDANTPPPPPNLNEVIIKLQYGLASMSHKCQWHWYNPVFNCSKSSRVQSEPAERPIYHPTTRLWIWKFQGWGQIRICICKYKYKYKYGVFVFVFVFDQISNHVFVFVFVFDPPYLVYLTNTFSNTLFPGLFSKHKFMENKLTWIFFINMLKSAILFQNKCRGLILLIPIGGCVCALDLACQWVCDKPLA